MRRTAAIMDKTVSTSQRPTNFGANRIKRQDFPVEGFKGSVALLRSKFGNANTTDTNQIFGANRGVTRSKTFHTSSNADSSLSNNKNATPAVLRYQRTDSDNKPVNAVSPSTLRVLQNNNYNELEKPVKEITPKLPQSPQDGTRSHARGFLINALSSPSATTKPLPAQHSNNNSLTSTSVESSPKSSDVSKSETRQSKRLSPTNISSSDSLEAEIPTQPVFRSVSCVQSRVVPTNLSNRSPITNTPRADLRSGSTTPSDTHGTASPAALNSSIASKSEKDQTKFGSSYPLTMADPVLVAKYSHITDMEELNTKLKDTRDFEERRALRAAIRKLRNALAANESAAATTEQRNDNSSSLDLSSYTSEEDLKILLHQTTSYEDKKRIRAAIRDIRKQSDGNLVESKQVSNVEMSVRSPSTPDKDWSAQEDFTTRPPSTPDAANVLRNMANGSAGETTQDDEQTTQDDVLVSPIKHECRTLQRPDGDIQIETYSKHSRTTSQSDVYEKSTKVTKTSKVGDLEISEQNEIVTKEKLSLKGSITTESDLVRKVDIKEKDGSRVIEEEITLERASRSKTSGAEETSAVQVSIVRERYPPRISKELVDMTGMDGDLLTLICEVEVSTGDDSSIDVTWLKDGNMLKANKDVKILWESPVATLEIKELLYPDDSGCYTCQAKNKYGMAKSSANITVKEIPVSTTFKFCNELADMSVTDGDLNVTLTCKLFEKSDDVNITWYKNGKVIKNGSEFKQTFDGEKACLVISEVFPEDSGEYECSATKGSLELSSYCKIKVQDAPKKKTEIIGKGIEEDTNNNTCDKEVTTPITSTAETLSNGIDKTDTAEKRSADVSNNVVEKCEERLKDASIANQTAAKQDVVDTKSKPSSDTGDRTSKSLAASSKPALKSVGMSRPGVVAEDTADSLVRKFSKPGTAGSVSVNQSWKSNVSGNTRQTQTNANKSWGKMGAMSTLLGKSAAGGSRGAMAAFKQMDTANNPNAGSAPKPKFRGAAKGGQPSVVEGLLRWCQLMTKEYQNASTGGGQQRSATTIKQMLLDWCKYNTKEYENVSIDNFSTSWNTGVAFLALIHHFYPDSFEWEKVDERRRRENFQLAFDIAEKKADISPLLDVDDMVRMKKPDWKCVFTYVQSFYRKLRDHENNKHTYMQQ